jgi:hypothetical protein
MRLRPCSHPPCTWAPARLPPLGARWRRRRRQLLRRWAHHRRTTRDACSCIQLQELAAFCNPTRFVRPLCMYVFMCVSPCRSSHGVDDCPLSRCCVSVSRSFVLFSKQLLDPKPHSPRHNAVLFCLAPLCTMHCHASRHAPAPQGLCVTWRRGAFPPPPALSFMYHCLFVVARPWHASLVSNSAWTFFFAFPLLPSMPAPRLTTLCACPACCHQLPLTVCALGLIFYSHD